MKTIQNKTDQPMQGDLAMFTAAVNRFTAAVEDLKPVLQSVKKVLTIEDVMRELGCSKSTIYNLIRRGKLTRLKLGRLARFRAQEVQELISEEG